jgi:hypothetical protein
MGLFVTWTIRALMFARIIDNYRVRSFEDGVAADRSAGIEAEAEVEVAVQIAGLHLDAVD